MEKYFSQNQGWNLYDREMIHLLSAGLMILVLVLRLKGAIPHNSTQELDA
ncbi:hypothetical protein KHA96_19695 [Bacillus sp. FJAT-49711]|nr:hypothetical protein [Bacillus sp. FJAT-49711]MBS4220530.1 hypothetical protein [Bacillus sp. FJAT-49711]